MDTLAIWEPTWSTREELAAALGDALGFLARSRRSGLVVRVRPAFELPLVSLTLEPDRMLFWSRPTFTAWVDTAEMGAFRLRDEDVFRLLREATYERLDGPALWVIRETVRTYGDMHTAVEEVAELMEALLVYKPADLELAFTVPTVPGEMPYEAVRPSEAEETFQRRARLQEAQDMIAEVRSWD